EVRDQSLGDIVEALRPYRRGILRISPQARALRVSGVFPLDDTDQALRSLQEVLPIKVETHFNWWTQLSLR
ncbi:MAG: iron dicitrate transport regulator FecR, partial [Pseudomonas caspiana]